MSADAEKMAQAKANWQMYLTLTQELLKFINKEDIDEFLDLVRQRNIIECQELVQKIVPIDMQVIYKAKAWLNKSRRQNATVHAYDLQDINPIGNILNRKY